MEALSPSPDDTPSAQWLRPKNIPSLSFTLCRWVDGKLTRCAFSLGTVKYVTVSHVWGVAEWRKIPGIADHVLASESKAKFIEQTLPTIVGEGYVWMDILCVNQNDKGARVAVTQYIPTIFRFAERTILVKDGGGLQGCCAQMFGQNDQAIDFPTKRLKDHIEKNHAGELLREGVLGRLWILQEVVLSNTIQVVSCETDIYRYSRTHDGILTNFVSSMFMSELHTLASSWGASSTNTSTTLIEVESAKFIYAFLHCNRLITRKEPVAPDTTFYSPAFSFNYNSRLQTTKPRDFILATMPQYGFYTVPSDAKQMTFSDLFLDLIIQVNRKMPGAITSSIFTARAILSLRDLAFCAPPDKVELPEPACLGDMVKLLSGPVIKFKVTDHEINASELHSLPDNVVDRHLLPPQLTTSTASRYVYLEFAQSHPVVANSASSFSNLSEFVAFIQRVDRCKWVWKMIAAGQRYQDVLENATEHTGVQSINWSQPARLALRVIIGISLDGEYSRLKWPPGLEDWVWQNVKCILMVASLMSCGLGVSAYEWAARNLIPVQVHWNGGIFLALGPVSLSHQESDYQYLLAAADGGSDAEEFCLLAQSRKHPREYSMCLFPRLDLQDR